MDNLITVYAIRISRLSLQLRLINYPQQVAPEERLQRPGVCDRCWAVLRQYVDNCAIPSLWNVPSWPSTAGAAPVQHDQTLLEPSLMKILFSWRGQSAYAAHMHAMSALRQQVNTSLRMCQAGFSRATWAGLPAPGPPLYELWRKHMAKTHRRECQ